MKLSALLSLGVSCGLLFGVAETRGVTLEELHRDATLTPQTFARHFSKFRFVYNADVQKPESFLATQAGDCDDYATLASSELSARGYHCRLVAVRVPGLVHVICYVAEAHGYLDYNLRAKGSGLVSCGPELADIANIVAKSFKAQWTSVSEFTFSEGVKRLVATTVATDRKGQKS
jgi:hypothetical protein